MFAGIVGGMFAVPAIAQEDTPETVATTSDADEAEAVQEKVYA
ncbi:MAG: hypothetical protein R3C04_00460 [Hyphomonas sp.]